MSDPTFTIFIPATGRAHLAADALQSVLLQSFSDFEVLISNNGADPAVRAALDELLQDSRVRYFEQFETLDMVTHWETMSREATGRYFLLLTNRSVLKQDTLHQLNEIHAFGAKVISWCWDLYFDDHQMLLANGAADGKVEAIPSEVMLRATTAPTTYPYALPRALNSSVSRAAVRDIRARYGNAFGAINPDYTFAYHCLHSCESVTYINKPMMISQGLSVCNGNGVRGDARPYFSTLKSNNLFHYVPSRAELVENGIAEDYLRIAVASDRTDLVTSWDRANYYEKCLFEIEEKKRAKLVSVERLQELTDQMSEALDLEPHAVKREVVNRVSSLTVAQRLTTLAKNFMMAAPPSLHPSLLRMRGATPQKSALEAAGFSQVYS